MLHLNHVVLQLFSSGWLLPVPDPNRQYKPPLGLYMLGNFLSGLDLKSGAELRDYNVYIAKSLMYVKKNINCYSKNSQVHTYNTRGKNNLHTIPHSTSPYSEIFIHTGLQLYNTLTWLPKGNASFKIQVSTSGSSACK